MRDDEPRQPPPDAEPNRRGFLIACTGALGAGLGAAVAVPPLVSLAYPLSHETTSRADLIVPVGPPKLFQSETPVRVDLVADRTDAWNRIQKVKVGSAFVRRREGQLEAFSTECPHLGCGVDWDKERNKFYCACHKSFFSSDGAVENGPSPRGLDTLEIREEAKLVSIRYQRFRLGTSDKEPLS